MVGLDLVEQGVGKFVMMNLPIGLAEVANASWKSAFQSCAGSASVSSALFSALDSCASSCGVCPPLLNSLAQSSKVNFPLVHIASATAPAKGVGQTSTHTWGRRRFLTSSSISSGFTVAWLRDSTHPGHASSMLFSIVARTCLSSSNFACSSSGSTSASSLASWNSSTRNSVSQPISTTNLGGPNVARNAAASSAVFGYLSSTKNGELTLAQNFCKAGMKLSGCAGSIVSDSVALAHATTFSAVTGSSE
mmetsp:Transcript_83843/g.219019  ORF Transcript_83843/g.219019 Transcript_83843/m.219019 type:complete len:249 (+) Transcript_83843:719-1465(+)